MKKSLSEQIAEIKRELETRKRVYPGWIDARKISAGNAQHRMECLEAVLQTLESCGQQELFSHWIEKGGPPPP